MKKDYPSTIPDHYKGDASQGKDLPYVLIPSEILEVLNSVEDSVCDLLKRMSSDFKRRKDIWKNLPKNTQETQFAIMGLHFFASPLIAAFHVAILGTIFGFKNIVLGNINLDSAGSVLIQSDEEMFLPLLALMFVGGIPVSILMHFYLKTMGDAAIKNAAESGVDLSKYEIKEVGGEVLVKKGKKEQKFSNIDEALEWIVVQQ